jgi:hypothetical protein
MISLVGDGIFFGSGITDRLGDGIFFGSGITDLLIIGEVGDDGIFFGSGITDLLVVGDDGIFFGSGITDLLVLGDVGDVGDDGIFFGSGIIDLLVVGDDGDVGIFFGSGITDLLALGDVGKTFLDSGVLGKGWVLGRYSKEIPSNGVSVCFSVIFLEVKAKLGCILFKILNPASLLIFNSVTTLDLMLLILEISSLIIGNPGISFKLYNFSIEAKSLV